MSLADPSKQERVHEFLRKSLLGQELVNTQFHLFSARSTTSCRLTKPRVLCANNVLLAKNSKYFLDLLSSDVNPTDPSLSDLMDDHDVPSNIGIDDYGYASDSDLEDEEEPPIPAADAKKPQDQSVVRNTSSRISVTRQPKEDELSQDGSESDSSDIFVMSPEHPRLGEPFSDGVGSLSSVISSETVIQEPLGGDNKGANHHDTAARLRFLGNRHILVKDTAFQTWYTLLNYLYTGQLSFFPLTSAAPGGQTREPSTSSLDEPRCSAKSMYRLACKVGVDHLREEAFAHIRSNLSENNIIKELSCNIVSRHPELLEMELDVLYSLLASPPVVTHFPVFAQRIANKELPHGAHIIVGIHTRLLRAPLSWSNEPGAPPRSPSSQVAGTSEPSPAVPRPPSPPGVVTPESVFSPSNSLARGFSLRGDPPKSPSRPQGGGFGSNGGLSLSWGMPCEPDPGPLSPSRPVTSPLGCSFSPTKAAPEATASGDVCEDDDCLAPTKKKPIGSTWGKSKKKVSSWTSFDTRDGLEHERAR